MTGAEPTVRVKGKRCENWYFVDNASTDDVKYFEPCQDRNIAAHEGYLRVFKRQKEKCLFENLFV